MKEATTLFFCRTHPYARPSIAALLLGLASIGMRPLAVAAPSGPQPSKALVMIVGVAHFVSRRDIHKNAYVDGPLSAKRQAQVAEVVARLSRFHPTKVLVEVAYDDATVKGRYRRYLRHRFALGPSESDQYGFRLAARSGDREIYPVDTFDPALYDGDSPRGKRIDAYLRKHFNDVVDGRDEASERRDDDLAVHGTYLRQLQFLNTSDAIEANASWYTMFAGVGRGADNAGALYVAQWYSRNTFIFSNMLSVIRPGDRVVVIFGQGHEYLLREFVRLNPNLVDVDPLAYLR